MSLNWKEINLILEELDLPGSQIQGAVQSAFDVLGLRIHKKGVTRQLLIALSPGACRFHETFRAFPRSDKPLRFAQFLNSRIVNGWIAEAVQLGTDRIVRLLVRRGEIAYRLYIRLWSNAANVIVVGEDSVVLDAMRRLPKREEISGGHYAPDAAAAVIAPDRPRREYEIRELSGAGSFNAKIDAFYAEQGGALSLEALREQVRRNYEGRIGRLNAALERLRAKEAEFAAADKLREYGDLILANLAAIKSGDEWLEVEQVLDGFTAGDRAAISEDRVAVAGDRAHFLRDRAAAADTQAVASGDRALATAEDQTAAAGDRADFSRDRDRAAASREMSSVPNAPVPETIQIKLDPRQSPTAQAERYYTQYRKAKKGLADIQTEIRAGEMELRELENALARLLAENNPLILAKLLKTGGDRAGPAREQDKKRPGLSFRRGDWLLIVGRDATENDALLRRHVKGNDLWLHARDFPGSYVFIKQRPGKTVPLDILLDAGNLAIFYSKGRNNGEGNLFYTPVKYLRRAKNGPKGLVIPTQEKNLHVKIDEKRLRELERCRIEK